MKLKKYMWLIAVVLLLISIGQFMGGSSTIHAESTTVVTIEDPALDALIRKQLKLSDASITEKDMLSLQSISGASWLGIKSLKGLENAKNLTSIRMGENKISDLTPIANLTHLESINSL